MGTRFHRYERLGFSPAPCSSPPDCVPLGVADGESPSGV